MMIKSSNKVTSETKTKNMKTVSYIKMLPLEEAEERNGNVWKWKKHVLREVYLNSIYRLMWERGPWRILSTF